MFCDVLKREAFSWPPDWVWGVPNSNFVSSQAVRQHVQHVLFNPALGLSTMTTAATQTLHAKTTSRTAAWLPRLRKHFIPIFTSRQSARLHPPVWKTPNILILHLLFPVMQHCSISLHRTMLTVLPEYIWKIGILHFIFNRSQTSHILFQEGGNNNNILGQMPRPQCCENITNKKSHIHICSAWLGRGRGEFTEESAAAAAAKSPWQDRALLHCQRLN